MKTYRNHLWAEITVMLFGVFLVIDALFLKFIMFDYNMVGIGWLDPYFSHFYTGIMLIVIGIMLIVIGIVDMYRS